MKEKTVLHFLLGIALLFPGCYGDIYMHNPRGSNNRLNENTAQRRTNNRMFDSQNNNRGGYNVGDATDEDSGNDEDKQYQMKYFQSSAEGESYLEVSWTNQHGCGADNFKTNCQVVIQYMSQNTEEFQQENKKYNRIRAGTDTGRINYNNANENEGANQYEQRKNQMAQNDRLKKGLNEPLESYDRCTVRERNKNLYTSDQNLNGRNKAKNTRQNPNGNRNGLECPEERDYYPYFHSTPWKDIAVLVSDTSLCKLIKKTNFNTNGKHECIHKYRAQNGQEQKTRHFSKHNNKNDCEEDDGEWKKVYNYLEKIDLNQEECEANSDKYMWEIPYDGWNQETPYEKECLVKLEEPDCVKGDFSRVNHLGNSKDLEPLKYRWKLPYFPSNTDQTAVLRIRYNISTDDYNAYDYDAGDNDNEKVQNNPKIDVGPGELQLAINTAQFGRTFQDRSHPFILRTREGTKLGDRTIHQLNVQGKRGNIVQTFPAVEYDFYPWSQTVNEDHLLHIQWTGSNSHDNGGNGGDGDTGDAGEGTGGTDRNNMLCLSNLRNNFPMVMNSEGCLFKNSEVIWPENLSQDDAAIQAGSSGYFQCIKGCTDSLQNKGAMQAQLNNAPASFPGIVIKLKAGTYYFMCSRNNNFTNRSQKGTIIVENSKEQKKK